MQNKNHTRLLARKLRDARLASGLSQCQIAERLRKPQSYISRCESGARRIDIFELQEFARAYRKSLTFFVQTHDARTPQKSNGKDS